MDVLDHLLSTSLVPDLEEVTFVALDWTHRDTEQLDKTMFGALRTSVFRFFVHVGHSLRFLRIQWFEAMLDQLQYLCQGASVIAKLAEFTKLIPNDG